MVLYKVSLTLPASADFHVFFSETSVQLIKTHLEKYYEGDYSVFYSECKLLMHELFTNAINHSGSKEAEFEYIFTDDYFSIDMKTDGSGFTIKPVNPDSTPGEKRYTPPYTNKVGESFILHLDDDYEVVCNVLGEYELEFHNKERSTPVVGNVFSIPEHFGLFIITKLGFGVLYKRDKSGKNIFSVKRKLPI